MIPIAFCRFLVIELMRNVLYCRKYDARHIDVLLSLQYQCELFHPFVLGLYGSKSWQDFNLPLTIEQVKVTKNHIWCVCNKQQGNGLTVSDVGRHLDAFFKISNNTSVSLSPHHVADCFFCVGFLLVLLLVCWFQCQTFSIMVRSITFLAFLLPLTTSVTAFGPILPSPNTKSTTVLHGWLDKAFANDDSLGKPQNVGLTNGPKFNENVTVNGKSVPGAVAGQKLTAVANKVRVKIPVNCQKGDCGTCMVKLNGRQVKGKLPIIHAMCILIAYIVSPSSLLRMPDRSPRGQSRHSDSLKRQLARLTTNSNEYLFKRLCKAISNVHSRRGQSNEKERAQRWEGPNNTPTRRVIV